ncbi:MAG: hypothetical protein JRI53_08290 [Deltaproteobacteria bacterium]|nr:hypothetical protein [Deltaproteobacteria bacterium]
MATLDDLQKEKNIILSNISNYARKRETDSVLSESEKLEKIELLINRHGQIVLELEELRGNKSISVSTPNAVKTESLGKDTMTLALAREIGKKLREVFLSKLEGEGIHLQLIKGTTIYRTQSGKRVGIASATERQPHRWFLGLPVGGFDHAVLLCQREKGDLVEVSLPENFFMKYGSSMSQSKGQVKFNIVQRGSEVLVLVPNTDGVNATLFSSDHSFLF